MRWNRETSFARLISRVENLGAEKMGGMGVDLRSGVCRGGKRVGARVGAGEDELGFFFFPFSGLQVGGRGKKMKIGEKRGRGTGG